MSTDIGFRQIEMSSVFLCTETLTGSYGKKVSTSLRNAIESESLSDSQAVVFDLAHVCEFEYDFLAMILPLIKTLREKKIRFFCINPPRKLSKFLLKYGVDTAIQVEPTLDHVNAKFEAINKNGELPKMDLRFTNPFVEAIIHTISTQAQATAKPQKPKLKQHLLSDRTDVAALMTFSNNAYWFHVAITFNSEVAFKLIENMLGETYTEVNSDVVDCIAEILNIVYGQAKPHLAPYEFDLANTKSETADTDSSKKWTSQKFPTMCIPFKSEIGTFHMEFAIGNKEKEAAA